MTAFIIGIYRLGPAELPTIPEKIAPSWFLVAGPFSVGVREGLVDVTWAVGGPEKLAPKEGERLPSWMVRGGWARWRRVMAKEGWVNDRWTDVDWKILRHQWGYAGLIHVGYAYTEIELPRPMRALAVGRFVSVLWVNGRQVLGDIYGHPYLKVPVPLDAGRNRIVLRIGRGTDLRFGFWLEPAEADLIALTGDVTFASPVLGRPYIGGIAVPIINTTGQWIKDGRMRLTLSLEGETVIGETAIPPLAPYGVVKPFLLLRSEKPVTGGDLRDGQLPVQVILLRGKERLFTATLQLPVRHKGQARRETFVSAIDGSLQQYGIMEPKGYSPRRRYGLILTLHGAGVDALGQVKAYRPKDWTFIVAPTNRRRFGFDWQDWGRLDALEVLRVVMRRYPIDPDRVYLTGHSMGGHGTWYLGTRHADAFAAIAPSAGWADFSLYVPFTLRRSNFFAPPGLLRVWWTAVRADLLPPFVENLINLKVFVLHGGADKNVPPMQGRLMAAFAHMAGIPIRLVEVKGQGHWWNLKETPYVDCVDDPELMNMFRWTKRTLYPLRVVFRTADLGDGATLYWVEVVKPLVWTEEVRVEAEVTGYQRVRVWTQNVQAIKLSPGPLLREGQVRVVIDGQVLTVHHDPKKGFTLVRDGGRWSVGVPQSFPLEKRPMLTGPMKRAYFHPFLLVYGDKGDPEEVDENLRLAVFEAWYWYWRGNGMARVVPDSAITGKDLRRFNLIVFGRPQSSHLIQRQLQRLPFRLVIKRDALIFGKHRYLGKSIGVKMIYPVLGPDRKPTGRLMLINTGTDRMGVRLAASFPVLASGVAAPDFVVLTPKVKVSGWGGLLAAGFFDGRWGLASSATYFHPSPSLSRSPFTP